MGKRFATVETLPENVTGYVDPWHLVEQQVIRQPRPIDPETIGRPQPPEPPKNSGIYYLTASAPVFDVATDEHHLPISRKPLDGITADLSAIKLANPPRLEYLGSSITSYVPIRVVGLEQALTPGSPDATPAPADATPADPSGKAGKSK